MRPRWHVCARLRPTDHLRLRLPAGSDGGIRRKIGVLTLASTRSPLVRKQRKRTRELPEKKRVWLLWNDAQPACIQPLRRNRQDWSSAGQETGDQRPIPPFPLCARRVFALPRRSHNTTTKCSRLNPTLRLARTSLIDWRGSRRTLSTISLGEMHRGPIAQGREICPPPIRCPGPSRLSSAGRRSMRKPRCRHALQVSEKARRNSPARPAGIVARARYLRHRRRLLLPHAEQPV